MLRTLGLSRRRIRVLGFVVLASIAGGGVGSALASGGTRCSLSPREGGPSMTRPLLVPSVSQISSTSPWSEEVAYSEDRAEECRLRALSMCDHLTHDPNAYATCVNNVLRVCLRSPS